MDYVAEINDIESKLKRLKTELQSATREDKIFFLQQSILVLQQTRLEIYKKQNTRPGNC